MPTDSRHPRIPGDSKAKIPLSGVFDKGKSRPTYDSETISGGAVIYKRFSYPPERRDALPARGRFGAILMHPQDAQRRSPRNGLIVTDGLGVSRRDLQALPRPGTPSRAIPATIDESGKADGNRGDGRSAQGADAPTASSSR